LADVFLSGGIVKKLASNSVTDQPQAIKKDMPKKQEEAWVQ